MAPRRRGQLTWRAAPGRGPAAGEESPKRQARHVAGLVRSAAFPL